MDRTKFSWCVVDDDDCLVCAQTRDDVGEPAVKIDADGLVVNAEEWEHLKELVDDMFDSFCDDVEESLFTPNATLETELD